MPFHNTKIRKQMEKIYRQVSVKERLPEKAGVYNTDLGKLEFSTNPCYKNNGIWLKENYVNNPEIWLEEVELPTEDEILEYARDEEGLEDYDMEQDVFVDGANYILNNTERRKE